MKLDLSFPEPKGWEHKYLDHGIFGKYKLWSLTWIQAYGPQQF